jgi:hypothetical protein
MIAWFLLALSTKEEFTTHEKPDPYFIEFAYPPAAFRQAEYGEWLTLLSQQERLLLQIPHPNGKNPRLVDVLEGQTLKKFTENLQQSVRQWSFVDHYELAMQELHQYIDRTVLPSVFDVLDSQVKLLNAPPPERLIQVFAKAVQDELSPLSSLWQPAKEQQLKQLQKLLDQWRSALPDAMVVNQYAGDPEQDLQRAWLFCQRCLESPRSIKKLHIAFGRHPHSPESLNFLPVPFDGDVDSLWSLNHYRYFLDSCPWSAIAEPHDIPVKTLSNSISLSLANVPSLTDISNLDRFLKGSLLDKQFDISPLSTVVLNLPSLESIVFLPKDKNSFDCLFKVILETRDKHTLCCFGQIDAINGKIKLHGYPSNSSNQTASELLLYLVALAYRDLIVARDRLPQSQSPEYRRKLGNKPPRSSKRSPSKPLNRVVLLPRMSQGIDSSLGSPERVQRAIQKLAPHFRTDHVRKLHEGWQASTRQLELAESLNVFVPTGYTYVRVSNPTGQSAAEIQETRNLFRSLSLLELMFN